MTIAPAVAIHWNCSAICDNRAVQTSPFDRSPLQGALTLLLGAALYTVLLPQAVSMASALPVPSFLDAIDDRHVRFWAWNQALHTSIVLLLALPFAWALSRLYARRLVPAALLVVMPTLVWMGLDYLMMRDTLPDAPPVMNLFYAIDAAKVLLVLPLLSLLLRARAARTERPA